ncbi:MAG: hydrogenase maturation nickel metallochaperone HypA [Candidatus Limivicinus sp.]
MHELGLCDAMLKMVRDIAKKEALEGVRSITVEVGTLSGVIPHFLTDCWEAVIDGTELAETKLFVETLAGTAKCLSCNAEFTADPEKLLCPVCGGRKLTPLTGRDMTIKEIEAY